MIRGQDARLDAAFLALADPTRRAILARLTRGEATVMQLAEPFEMTQPAISRHLKVLEGAGLIVRRRDAQWRPCRIEAAPLKEVAECSGLALETLSRLETGTLTNPTWQTLTTYASALGHSVDLVVKESAATPRNVRRPV